MAWARSMTTVACACFVVACFKFMPSISATSCITWETKTLPLSVMMSLSRWARLIIMFKITFAVFTAVGLKTGWANAYLEKTSFVVMIFS